MTAHNPRNALDQHQIMPKKSLGQNFLHDPNALDKIVASAELAPTDTVLEVGPGTGALTERLAEAAARVVAVEVDTRMSPILARFDADPRVHIVYGDFLDQAIAGLIAPAERYVVVANVPYYITSAILRHVLESTPRPSRIVMTVQLEVAERVVARPGDMSLLAVSAQYYGVPRIAARLNKAVFYPRPDVDSAVLRIDLGERPRVDAPSDALFFRVARAGFGQKRKQLRNSLAEGLSISAEKAAALLERAAIDPRRRAETLTLAEWAALSRAYAAETA
jgi:16S rRNA (adenine1518-N6/adenine1519-N6)-dimethyltransferase